MLKTQRYEHHSSHHQLRVPWRGSWDYSKGLQSWSGSPMRTEVFLFFFCALTYFQPLEHSWNIGDAQLIVNKRLSWKVPLVLPRLGATNTRKTPNMAHISGVTVKVVWCSYLKSSSPFSIFPQLLIIWNRPSSTIMKKEQKFHLSRPGDIASVYQDVPRMYTEVLCGGHCLWPVTIHSITRQKHHDSLA